MSVNAKGTKNCPSGRFSLRGHVSFFTFADTFFSSAARFLHRSDTLFVMSVMTNSHELPCISFFPLTPFVTLSRPLQFLQFVTMVTVACRFLLVPVPALVSAICKTLFCQEQLLQDERKKVLIVSLHTRAREQTDKFPPKRVLLTLTDVA